MFVDILSIILPKSLMFDATSFVSPTFGKIISNLLLLSALAIFLANISYCLHLLQHQYYQAYFLHKHL